MNILFTRFPTESRLAGTEIQTISLMRGLASRGHTVTFAGSCKTILQLCAAHGIPAVACDIGLPPFTKWDAITFLWRQFAMKKALRRLLDQLPAFDVMCMLTLSEKILLTDYAASKGKIFWIEHDRIGPWLRQNPWLRVLRRQSKFVTIVTVSDLSRRALEKVGFATKVHTIQNGVDLQKFSGSPSIRASNGLFHVICVARLVIDKGIYVLLEACKDLPDVRLTFAGGGPEADRFLKKIRQMNMENRCVILPSTDDMPSVYARMDAMALPSLGNDPCPLAVPEAMACGVPVIVSDAVGTAEYIENGKDGLVVEQDDPSALREAIIVLKQDVALRSRIATNGQATAVRKFSLERMVDDYEKLLSV